MRLVLTRTDVRIIIANIDLRVIRYWCTSLVNRFIYKKEKSLTRCWRTMMCQNSFQVNKHKTQDSNARRLEFCETAETLHDYYYTYLIKKIKQFQAFSAKYFSLLKKFNK